MMGVLFLLGALSLSAFHCAEAAPERSDLAQSSCLHGISDGSSLHCVGETVRSDLVSDPNDLWTTHLDVTDDQTPDDSSDLALLPSISVEKVQFRDMSPARGVVRVVATTRKKPLPLRC
jgi:hypothetical protein